MSCTTIMVNPVPPFRLDLTVWALRRRAENIIDRWDGRTYSRAFVLDGKAVELEVTQIGTHTRPRLRVIATGPRLTRRGKRIVSTLVERMLGTRVDLTKFYRLAAQQPELGDLVRRFRGLKPPRFPTVFEALLTAFACQQLSLALGVLLLNRLTETYGVAVEQIDGRICAFPRPEDLSAEQHEALGKLGFSRQKARAIIELSLAVSERRLRPGEIHGIGRRYASKAIACLTRSRSLVGGVCVAARTRSAASISGDDVGAQNKLQRYLGLKKPPSYDTVRRRLAQWGDYAGLIYFHLLLHGLAEKGYSS